MQVVPFDFEESQVRVVSDDFGVYWFVAADLLGILELDRKALERIDADDRGVSTIHTLGGEQKMTVVNESGMYALILGSRKQEARKFKRWVTSEVLPSIRKTGQYAAGADSLLALPNFSDPAAAARAWAEQYEARLIAEKTKAEIGSRREATAMNTASQAVKKAAALEIQLDRSKEYCTVKRMSMIHHGQPFNWRELKAASAEMGIAPIDVFDQNYGTVKAWHVDVWREVYGITLESMQ